MTEFDPKDAKLFITDKDGVEHEIDSWAGIDERVLVSRRGKSVIDRLLIDAAFKAAQERRNIEISTGYVISADECPDATPRPFTRNIGLLRGNQRNKICHCGSGLKCKHCPCGYWRKK